MTASHAPSRSRKRIADSFSPEFRLLLACSLHPLRDREIERLRSLLAGPVDWPAVVRLSRRHGVTPPALLNLREHAQGQVPAPILERMRGIVERNRRHCLALLRAWNELADPMKDRGIPYCGLKGILLSQRLYDDFSLRMTGDVDFLIPQEHVPAVHALLLECGYQMQWPSRELTPRQWKAHARLQHHMEYRRPVDRVFVEPHWSLYRSFLLPKDLSREILRRAREIRCAGRAFPFCSDEDALFHLLLHGARHGWASLKWIVDVAMLLRAAPDIRLADIRGSLAEMGFARCYDQAVQLARELFDAAPGLPEPPAPRAHVPPAVWYALQSRDNRYGIRGRTRRGFFLFQLTGVAARLRKDPRIIFALIGWYWVDADDWADVPLPDALFPLYFVLHPFLKILRGIRKRSRSTDPAR